MRGRVQLRISSAYLVKYLREGMGLFYGVANFPEDTTIVNSYVQNDTATLVLTLESQRFPVVKDGEPYPVLELLFASRRTRQPVEASMLLNGEEYIP